MPRGASFGWSVLLVFAVATPSFGQDSQPLWGASFQLGAMRWPALGRVQTQASNGGTFSPWTTALELSSALRIASRGQFVFEAAFALGGSDSGVDEGQVTNFTTGAKAPRSVDAILFYLTVGGRVLYAVPARPFFALQAGVHDVRLVETVAGLQSDPYFESTAFGGWAGVGLEPILHCWEAHCLVLTVSTRLQFAFFQSASGEPLARPQFGLIAGLGYAFKPPLP
jgi:hypothetical protein